MAASELEDRQCPYCRCTFTPAEPEQRYCSPFCEQADKERRQ
jgi:hypothetical protein